MAKFLTAVIVYIFAFVSVISAQNLVDWQVFTYMNDISDITESESKLWVSTSGGIYSFDLQDSTIKQYNNLDGLASLQISCLARDNRGNLIAGSENGILHFKAPESNLWEPYFDLRGEEITDIYTLEDTLWVAANSGLGVFLNTESGPEFRDFYINFPIEVSTGVRVYVYNNMVYFATGNGLLHASANFLKQNLKIAQAWQVYTTSDGLPSNIVNDLATFNNVMYVATELGAAQIDLNSDISTVPGYNSGTVKHIITNSESLIFSRSNDYYTHDGTNWEYGTQFDKNIACGVITQDNDVWFGFQKSGIRHASKTGYILVDGPAANNVGNLIKDSRGILWMASGKFKLTPPDGFYKYDFSQWTNYKFTGSWNWKNSTDWVIEDKFGKIWFGAWGGGVTIIDGDQFEFYHGWSEPGELVVSTTSGETTLSFEGIAPDRRNCLVGANVSVANYTVSTYFIEDRDENLWIANYLASIPQYIAVLTDYNTPRLPDCASWMYFGDNIGLSIQESEISSFAFENIGDRERLWMGTFSRGLRVLDHKNTITDPTDDVLYELDMINNNLFSNTVLCLNTDLDGVMWIGTAGGLNSYQPGSSSGSVLLFRHVGETGPIENKINCIFVDASNNKWFGTDGGMSILIADRSPWDANAWVHYTTENSGLPDPIVNSIFVDKTSGEAYIGTQSGLAIFKGSFAEIRSDMNLVTGGPNPFILESGNQFTIKNLAVNSQVKIFNLSGRLIRVLSTDQGTIQGSRAVWDGTDETGTKVSSGIYLYLAFNEQGQTGTGKIAVIRP